MFAAISVLIELANLSAVTASSARCASTIPPAFTLTAPVPSAADNSILEPSTVTSNSSALAVIPSPPITLSVTSPAVPPPVSPAPAATPVTSPAGTDKSNVPAVSSYVIVTEPSELPKTELT